MTTDDILVTFRGTDLARGTDAPDETEEDKNPGEDETAEQLPADTSHVLNAGWDLQHMVPAGEGVRG